MDRRLLAAALRQQNAAEPVVGLGKIWSDRKRPVKQRDRALGIAPAIGHRADADEDMRIVLCGRPRRRFAPRSRLSRREPRPRPRLLPQRERFLERIDGLIEQSARGADMSQLVERIRIARAECDGAAAARGCFVETARGKQASGEFALPVGLVFIEVAGAREPIKRGLEAPAVAGNRTHEAQRLGVARMRFENLPTKRLRLERSAGAVQFARLRQKRGDRRFLASSGGGAPFLRGAAFFAVHEPAFSLVDLFSRRARDHDCTKSETPLPTGERSDSERSEESG